MSVGGKRAKKNRGAATKAKAAGAAEAAAPPSASFRLGEGAKDSRLALVFLKKISFEEAARQKAQAFLLLHADKKAAQKAGPAQSPRAGRASVAPASGGKEEGAAGAGLLEILSRPVEKAFIEIALLVCQGNQTKTAACLGWNRNTLKKKMDGFQLSPSHHVQKNMETSGKDLIVSSYEDLDLEELARRKLLFLWEEFRKIPDLTAEVRPAIEKAVIEIGLRHSKGRKKKAAALLGLNQGTLNSKIKLYKITAGKKQEQTA